MGSAAYNRGSKAISQQITREQEVKAGRMYDRIAAEYNQKVEIIERQAEEIEHLKAELERAKQAYQRRTAERNLAQEERQEAERERDYYREQWRGAFATIMDLDRKWRFCSTVIRRGLTPEEYHELRKRIEREVEAEEAARLPATKPKG